MRKKEKAILAEALKEILSWDWTVLAKPVSTGVLAEPRDSARRE
jgi:hypothetical protein